MQNKQQNKSSKDKVIQNEIKTPEVAVLMGSDSDWLTMRIAAEILKDFQINYEAKVVSAHRTPDLLFSYAETAKKRGIKIIIAGAGGAAHLPGMLASKTALPVLGVPILSKSLSGIDSLYSIVQMPRGIPVATFAIGEAGAANAALFAIQMLAVTQNNNDLWQQLETFRQRQSDKVLAMSLTDV